MRVLPLINLGLLMVIVVGFRTESTHRWDISREQPTLWIELDEALYAGDGFGSKVDDLKGALTPLKGLPASDQRTEMWRIILDDFASVKTSFLRLYLKPGQVDSIDADHEEVYDEDYAKTHTIKIRVGTGRGAGSGYARQIWDGRRITGCEVVIAKYAMTTPDFLAHTLSHEILHCLGLLHQQDDADSLMSYSNFSVGLSLEERMALTYLYSLDPSSAKESPTLGLACEPAK